MRYVLEWPGECDGDDDHRPVEIVVAESEVPVRVLCEACPLEADVVVTPRSARSGD